MKTFMINFGNRDAMEKAVIKKPKTKDLASVQHYATALDILESLQCLSK